MCHEGYRCSTTGSSAGDYTFDQCMNLCTGLSAHDTFVYASPDYSLQPFPVGSKCLCPGDGCASVTSDPNYNIYTKGSVQHCERPPTLPPSPPPPPPSPPMPPPATPPSSPPNHAAHCLDAPILNRLAGVPGANGATFGSLEAAATACYNQAAPLAVLAYAATFYCRVSDGAGDSSTSFTGATLYMFAASCVWDVL